MESFPSGVERVIANVGFRETPHMTELLTEASRSAGHRFCSLRSTDWRQIHSTLSSCPGTEPLCLDARFNSDDSGPARSRCLLPCRVPIEFETINVAVNAA